MDKNHHYINSTPSCFKTEVTLMILYKIVIRYTYIKREKIISYSIYTSEKTNKKNNDNIVLTTGKRDRKHHN